MFVCAGEATPTREKSGGSRIAQALTLIASQISPPTNERSEAIQSSNGAGNVVSPSKVIESRSKCYRQL